MHDLDSNTDLLLLEDHIGEVETRLNMLRDQIVAMLCEEDGIGAQSQLLFSTRRALRSLQQLRLEMRDDRAQPSAGDRVS